VGTQQVGPAISTARADEPKFDWKKLNFDSPLIYVAGLKGEALEKVLAAAGLIDAQFVIAGEIARTPKNVIATPYSPQIKLLGRATAFVTSGGAASVMESVAAGVPMLVCPQAGEEFVTAEFVKKTKNGTVANLAKDDAAEKLRGLLDPASGQLRPAARLKDAYSVRDGAKTAAELIAKLAG
jgi:UDP:flavonoid glycosyltransferase YjiC (YdhE family)